MFFIKEIKLKDARICYDIDLISLNLWSQKQWENELKKNNINGLGIYSNKSIIGLCIFLKIFDEAELRYFSIVPKFKRKGLGKKLFNELTRSCNKENIDKVFLEVSITNNEAIGFYKYLGFETIGIRKNYYRDGSDAILMKKKMLKK
tara:strand:- start:1265 stop:1705 length:441 start_codon:yes stop_codon:yes gene_type:complete